MHKRGRTPKTDAPTGYVRFTKAVELFQPLSKNTLNYRVRTGDIQTQEDEYGKMYQIDSLLKVKNILIEEQFKESIKKRTIPDIVLDWVRPEDVPSGLALDQMVYNEMLLASAEVYMAWRRKNPKISMGAFDAKDRRIRYGYIGLIPLPETVILDVLMGKKEENDITPDEIRTYIAYYLRKLGRDVSLVEREEIGSQASSAAAGLLAPLAGPGPLADLLLSSFAMFPSLVPELEDASGIRLEYERLGALRTVRNPKRVVNLKKRMRVWEPLGLQMYWLTGEEARQREPLLGPDVCAAIYAPEESQIKASQVVQAFAKAAQN